MHVGELIRNLGCFHIKGIPYAVELNKCTRPKGLFDVHLQSKTLRLNISEKDFCKMAAAVIYADEKLSKYKNAGD